MALVDVAIAVHHGVESTGTGAAKPQVANQQRLFGRAFSSSSLLRSLRA
jgi:hypothetical protein